MDKQKEKCNIKCFWTYLTDINRKSSTHSKGGHSQKMNRKLLIQSECHSDSVHHLLQPTGIKEDCLWLGARLGLGAGGGGGGGGGASLPGISTTSTSAFSSSTAWPPPSTTASVVSGGGTTRGGTTRGVIGVVPDPLAEIVSFLHHSTNFFFSNPCSWWVLYFGKLPMAHDTQKTTWSQAKVWPKKVKL